MIRYDYEWTIQIGDEDVECGVVLDHYSPSRPPPPCSDPSSAAYADPGDGRECECRVYRMADQTLGEPSDADVEITDELTADEYEEVCDRIEEALRYADECACEDAALSRYEAHRDGEW